MNAARARSFTGASAAARRRGRLRGGAWPAHHAAALALELLPSLPPGARCRVPPGDATWCARDVERCIFAAEVPAIRAAAEAGAAAKAAKEADRAAAKGKRGNQKTAMGGGAGASAGAGAAAGAKRHAAAGGRSGGPKRARQVAHG